MATAKKVTKLRVTCGQCDLQLGLGSNTCKQKGHKDPSFFLYVKRAINPFYCR